MSLPQSNALHSKTDNDTRSNGNATPITNLNDESSNEK